jgi:hypothetical protein
MDLEGSVRLACPYVCAMDHTGEDGSNRHLCDGYKANRVWVKRKTQRLRLLLDETWRVAS